MARLPTVAIRGTDGARVVINERDFDPSRHERFDETPAEEQAEPEAVPEYRVENTSPGWWKVFDAGGKQVGAAHRSEAEAEDVLRELTGGD